MDLTRRELEILINGLQAYREKVGATLNFQTIKGKQTLEILSLQKKLRGHIESEIIGEGLQAKKRADAKLEVN